MVDVYITKNSGTNFIMAYLDYDPDVFEFVAITPNEEFVGGEFEIIDDLFSWDSDKQNENNVQSEILLFSAELKVKTEGRLGSTTIGLVEDDMDCTFYNSETGRANDHECVIVPGTITITRPVTGAEFVNGTQKLNEEDARQEALGTWEDELANPGEGYVFAGWFSGLNEDYKNTDGFYVVDITENKTITGSELRPRYDNATEGVTYNALWILGGTSSVLVVNDDQDTIAVCSASDDSSALNNAINGVLKGERVKLVKEMTCKNVIFNNSSTNDLWLDLNGYAIKASSGSPLKMNSNTTAYNLTIDSGRGQGALVYTPTVGSTAALGNTAKSTLDLKNIKLDGRNTITFSEANIVDCEIINWYNQYSALTLDSANPRKLTISGGKLDAAGAFITVNAAEVTISNCTMISSGSQKVLFTGKQNMTMDNPNLPPSGKLILGEGNTLTASKCTTLCKNFEEVYFSSLTGDYQLSTSTSNPFNAVTKIKTYEDKGWGIRDGLLIFGSKDARYTVTYMSCDGNDTLYTREVLNGSKADLDLSTTYTGSFYAHVGWSDEKEGTPLNSLVVRENTILYAVRREMDVFMGGAEFTGTDYETLFLGELTITNISKMNKLNSVNVKGYSAAETEKYPYDKNEDGTLKYTTQNLQEWKTYGSVKFLTDTLASIQGKAYTSVTIDVEAFQPHDNVKLPGINAAGESGMIAVSPAVKLGEASARIVFSVREGTAPINFTGDVEVMVQFKPVNDGRSYYVVYISDSGEPEKIVDLTEENIVTEGNITYAKFTTNKAGTYEVRDDHTHVFDQKITHDDFLATAGDCDTKATYYYSCACGKADTQKTFATDYVHAEPDDKGLCKECKKAPKTKLQTYSISLNGNIGVNFYVNVAEADKDNTKVKITVGEETTELPISDEMLTDGQYKVSVDVAAKQMTDEIVVELICDGKTVQKATTSVREYALTIIGDEKHTEETKNLVKAMLNYGAYSQAHFGYNTANLANADYEDSLESATFEAVTAYSGTPNLGDDTVKLNSTSLILESETTLRFFFTKTIGTATHGETPLKVTQRGSYYYVDVEDIAAKALNENVTITVDNVTIAYSPMRYAYSVMKNMQDNVTLVNLVKALYLYSVAADAYFE